MARLTSRTKNRLYWLGSAINMTILAAMVALMVFVAVDGDVRPDWRWSVRPAAIIIAVAVVVAVAGLGYARRK